MLEPDSQESDSENSVSITSTSSSSLSSLVETTSRTLSAMLHQALGERGKYYHYLVEDDANPSFQNESSPGYGGDGVNSVTFPGLCRTETESSQATSTRAGIPRRVFRTLGDGTQSQDGNISLHMRLSDSTPMLVQSGLQAQNPALELEGLRSAQVDRAQRLSLRQSQRYSPPLERTNGSLCSHDYSTEENRRGRSPDSSNQSSTTNRLDHVDPTIRSIRDEASSISQLVLALRTTENERLLALCKVQELEAEVEQLRMAGVSVTGHRDDSVVMNLPKIPLRQREQASCRDGVERDNVQKLREDVLRVEAALEQSEKERHSKERALCLEQEKNSILFEELCLLKKKFEATDEQSRHLRTGQNGVEGGLSHTGNSEDNAEQQQKPVQTEPFLNEDALVDSDDMQAIMSEKVYDDGMSITTPGLSDSVCRVQTLPTESRLTSDMKMDKDRIDTAGLAECHEFEASVSSTGGLAKQDSAHPALSDVDLRDENRASLGSGSLDGESIASASQASVDMFGSVEAFEKSVDAILESLDGETSKVDSVPVESEPASPSFPAATLASGSTENLLVTQCVSVLEALTGMVDNTDREMQDRHSTHVWGQLESLSGMIQSEASDDAIDQPQLDEVEDKHPPVCTPLSPFLRLDESPIRRPTRCFPSDPEDVRFLEILLVECQLSTHMSEEEETELSYCLANPIVKNMFRKLHSRCELLEGERSELLSETLELLESSRQSNEVEIEALVAEMERKTSQQVRLAEKRAREGLVAVATKCHDQFQKHCAFQKWKTFAETQRLRQQLRKGLD